MAAMSSHDPVFDTSFHARLLHPRWWGSWLALGFLCLLAWVPHGVRGRFANAVAPALLRLSKKQAYIAETNLKICFPELDAAGRRTLLLKAIRTGLKAFMGFGELTLRQEAWLDKLILEIQKRRIDLRKSREGVENPEDKKTDRVDEKT